MMFRDKDNLLDYSRKDIIVSHYPLECWPLIWIFSAEQVTSSN